MTETNEIQVGWTNLFTAVFGRVGDICCEDEGRYIWGLCNLSNAFATAGDEDFLAFGDIFQVREGGDKWVDVTLASLNSFHARQGR